MRAGIGATAIALLIVTGACGEDRPPCYRGDYVGCSCGNGRSGYQACRDAEDGYAACVCDGRTPGIDASVGDASAADASVDAPIDTGKRPLFAPCTTNDECESGLCFELGMGQRICTKPCTAATAATDCPAPSPGCNNKGVCRP